MKMLYSVLLVLCLAALMSAEEEMPKLCSQFTQCLPPDLDKYTDPKQPSDKDTCNVLQKAVSCLQPTVYNCQNNEDAANNQKQLDSVQKAYNDRCGASAVKISIALLLFALLSFLF